MQIETVNIDSLTPYEKNAKLHPRDQIEQIKKSIEMYGNNDPIAVWGENNVIVEGHGRYTALRELGYKTVDIIRLDHLTDEQRREYMLVHNQTTMNSGWDIDLLAGELEDLDFGGFDFGFDLDSLDDLFEDEKEIEEDEIPEKAETRCKLGDLWQLGEHRLICGDSTDTAVIDRLMDGVKADMVFCDPPYGMKKESEGVLNDNLNFDDLLDFNRQWIPLTFGALKDNGSWYCWGIDEPLMDIYSNILKPMAKENKITFRNLITWKKENDNPTMLFNGACSSNSRSYYTNEKCLFVMCGEQDMRFKRNLEEFNEMFEPIRKWFEDERKKSGLSVEQISKIDSTRCSHYWAKVQFEFPTKEAFCKIQNYCANNGINAFGVEYEEIKKEYDELKKEYDELKKEYYSERAYFDGTKDQCIDVWVYDATSQSEREHTGGHATPKPIALCSRAIKSSSREGEVVLDVFGGSGSTLIACEQLNRKCYMAELDEHYCDVIIQRWENLTGKKATIIKSAREE